MEAMARKGRLPAERRQAAARRAGLAAWSIVRGILLAGICFVVLFPLFSKVSRSFMAVEDLYNLTVRYIPAHFTLQNYQLMWAWMDMPKTLFTTLGISLLVAFCQTAAATWVVSSGMSVKAAPALGTRERHRAAASARDRIIRFIGSAPIQ